MEKVVSADVFFLRGVLQFFFWGGEGVRCPNRKIAIAAISNLLGVPKPGCLQFFTQKRSVALFCGAPLRHLRSFALILQTTAFRTTGFGNCRQIAAKSQRFEIAERSSRSQPNCL